ncbi:FAD-dependent oxidoreductase [Microlunatus antarcticus]|uniref:Thioredoxin reductase/SAM-dependent methyltransferase n=1 Tax=Microlunatus antarcticus TaxID=53388 RepID=A0A7W5JSU5_9ACTN|nr:FAD-dependent oxidoreductase [Microlunatus antarcticus]MBB3325082.1 thioredoxin reductase/SAM-dependent methyltransferase [Microlunatus antarcticus]
MTTEPAQSSPDAHGSTYDVLVVGGGPAGLSAAVALARSLRSVLVVDAGAPRNATAAGVHNYLGRENVSPADLLADGRSALTSYGGRVETGEVVRLEPLGQEPSRPWFGADLADGRRVEARRVVVATGLTDELPAIPGLAPRWGRDVLHCPYCHGYEARDTAIGILSSTPMTAHQALMFRQLSPDVTVLTHTGPALSAEDRERLESRGVRFADGEVVEVLTTDDALSGVRLADGTVVPLQNLAIAAPAVAHSALLADLGVEVADFAMGDFVFGSYAVAEPTGVTSVPGVYTAGNVSTIQAQVSTSAAGGLMTGALVNAHLIEEEATQAVAERRRTEAFWDERYREGRMHPREANPTLVETTGTLPAGTALDLGSGYGDDAVWLARQGWRVLGIDVSGTAVEHARTAAEQAGVAGRATFERHDLALTFPTGTFDLVTTHYLHAPDGLPRDEVLRRAAAAVAPGGTLLVVGHASLPPWSWEELDTDQHAHDQEHGHGQHGHGHGPGELPSPEEVWAGLALDDEWEAVRLEVAPRAVTGPTGEHGAMDDSVVVARRRAETEAQTSAASPSSSRSTSSVSV